MRAGLGAAPGGLECVWSDQVDRIIDRIRREWDELGRDPIPGEVVWLDKVRLDPMAEAMTVSHPTETYTQRDGTHVFVQEIGGRYNVVMERQRGGNGSWEGISIETLHRLTRSFGWTRS